MPKLSVRNLTKSYPNGDSDEIEVIDDISFDVHEGELLGIVGPSGCGKTTLLKIIAGLLEPDEGQVFIDGKDTSIISGREIALFRGEKLGFVFQNYNLIPRLTVIENVTLPGLIMNKDPVKLEKKAHVLLKEVGIFHRADHKGIHLSGGEQQRVAIARCLVQEPDIFLLDEPTASLDWRAKTDILELVKVIHDSRHLTTLFVTHDLSSLPVACDRAILMKEGLIWGVGSPGETLTDDNLSRLYDIPISTVKKRREEAILV